MSMDIAAIERVWETHTAAEFVTVPLVAVVGMRGGLLTASRHRCSPRLAARSDGSAVTGVEQAEAVAPDAGAELFNALIMKPGSGAK
jgi:hypothetical protein